MKIKKTKKYKQIHLEMQDRNAKKLKCSNSTKTLWFPSKNKKLYFVIDKNAQKVKSICASEIDE